MALTVETLAAFLAARYDEAEALAKAAEADWDAEHAMYEWNDLPDAAFAYARNLSPKHRLADVKLKRAILAEHARVPVYTPETLALYPDKPEMASLATCRRCHELDPDAMVDEDRCGDLSYPCATVRQLGTEFAGHAAYKQEWRPE